MVVKIGLCSKPGFPNLMLLKDGKAQFIEVKQPGKHASALQEYRLKQLRDAGFEAVVMTE